MHQDKDRSAKWLITHHGDAVLKLAGITGFTKWRAVANEIVAPRRTPDGLLEVSFPGESRPRLHLIEIESFPGSDVDKQVFEDILLTRVDRGVIPRVISLILQPKGKARVEGQASETDDSGTVELSGHWPAINLWDVDAEALLASGDPGLAALATLTNSSQSPEELLTRCRDRLLEVPTKNDREGLLALAQIFARMRYPKDLIKLIFGGPEAMIESPALDDFKELVLQRAEAQFVAQGIADATRQNTIDNLELRFGSVPPAVLAKLAEVKDATRLRELFKISVTCPTIEAFETALQAY